MLSLEITLFLIIIMFFISFLYSNLGLGGGMLYVPTMVFIATSLDRLEIIPISLFLSLMTQLPAFYTHYKKGLVNVKLGLILGMATAPGALIGVLIGIRSTDILTYCLFSILLFLVGIKMVIDVYKNNSKSENDTNNLKISKKQLCAVFLISIGTGIVSSFFGVGGGIVTVPVLIYILGMYMRRAIGTSALMIVITSTIGFLCYNLLSFNIISITGVTFRDVPMIPFELTLILGIVVMIGAYLGSSWGLKALKTKNVRIVFIIIVFLVGIQLLLRALGFY